MLTAFSHSAEMRAGGIALIFWLIAHLLWSRDRWDSLASAALALLIEPLPEMNTLVCTGILIVFVFLARWWKVARRLFELARLSTTTTAIVCLIVLPTQRGSSYEPQYNASARTAARITREFTRNTWLVVSPVQEVALTYGHGWHMELSEFVEKFSVDEVRRPSFAFRFPVTETFVFVEKQPLMSRGMASGLSGLGSHFDPPTAPYLLRLNRASMQFRAARLMAAYTATHRNGDVFFEDQHVIVYRIRT
jgi:hypothetical protein